MLLGIHILCVCPEMHVVLVFTYLTFVFYFSVYVSVVNIPRLALVVDCGKRNVFLVHFFLTVSDMMIEKLENKARNAFFVLISCLISKTTFKTLYFK